MGRVPSRPLRARLALAALPAAVGVAWVAAPAVAEKGPSKLAVVGTPTNTFDPADFTVTPDASGSVTINFESRGAPHTMQSDDVANFNSGIVNAGAKKVMKFTAKPGVYDYYCQLHKSVGMVGKMTVTDKNGKAPAAATSTAGPSATASAASTAEPPNRVLDKLDAEKATNKGKIGGFLALLMASLVALVLAMIAMTFATRRRTPPTS